MAKENPYKKAIPRLYKRGATELTMFAWVQASKYYFPAMSVEEALRGWYKHFSIHEKDYPMATASTTYSRINEEFLQIEKDERDNKLT